MPTEKVTSVDGRIDEFVIGTWPPRAEEADPAYIYLFRICVWFRIAHGPILA